MPEIPGVTQPRTPPSRSVAQPDRTVSLSDSRRRPSASRYALEERRRRRARESALVTASLRDLARRQQRTPASGALDEGTS
jgi:hypothetical protein